MSDETLSVALPLDGEFLRRQCPNCGLEFKWLASEDGESIEMAQVPEHYYCPYCHEPASPDDWWTDAQQEYAVALVSAQIVTPSLREFQRDIQSMNRPDSLVTVDVNLTGFAEPEPLVEPEDMVRIEFPCHPEEPVKVDEQWRQPLACLVCGIRYPAELVRPLEQ